MITRRSFLARAAAGIAALVVSSDPVVGRVFRPETCVHEMEQDWKRYGWVCTKCGHFEKVVTYSFPPEKVRPYSIPHFLDEHPGQASALEQFSDFVEATGPSYWHDNMDVINEAVHNTYAFKQFVQRFGDVLPDDRDRVEAYLASRYAMAASTYPTPPLPLSPLQALEDDLWLTKSR